MVANAFNPNTWETKVGDLCKFKASMVYMASSRYIVRRYRTCTHLH